MEKNTFTVYGYRWVVLVAFAAVVAVTQILWITFASITIQAGTFYGVSDLSIGLLSMSFMIVFIIMSIPASWAIDTYGIRLGVGIGAALTAVFGLMRGLVASSYTWVLIAQIGIAIGQPFVLNAQTKVVARWFPVSDRATIVGFTSLALFLGIIIGMVVTPFLVLRSEIPGMLLTYGIISVIFGVLFFVLVRERPPTPPCPPEQEARSLVFDGLRQMVTKPDFLVMMAIFFVGLGLFNAVSTWIEDIVKPRGLDATQAGIIGGLMVLGGIVGAVILPSLSDHYHRRVPFVVVALIGGTLGLAGLTFFGTYGLLIASALFFGFFLLSAAPIGFQYGAEVTLPAPEGTSYGMLMLMGQISGIVFIFAMDSFRTPITRAMTPSLIVLIVLMAACIFLSLRLKEPPAMAQASGGAR
ncbi:MAG: MFS transporter [Anaerolineales bacterium]|jgi:MFS family permease